MIRSDVRLASTVVRRTAQLGIIALGSWACGQGDTLCDGALDEGVVVTIPSEFVDAGRLTGIAVEARFAGGNWTQCRGLVPSTTAADRFDVICLTNRAGQVSVRATTDDGSIREDAFEAAGDECGPFAPVRLALEDLPIVVEGSGEGSGDP